MTTRLTNQIVAAANDRQAQLRRMGRTSPGKSRSGQGSQVNAALKYDHAAGFALVAVMITLMIVSIMAIGSMRLSGASETLAGNGIQRSRSFQAADGASLVAEKTLQTLRKRHFFADTDASEGLFSRDGRDQAWWRQNDGNGVHKVDSSAVVGVVEPPRFAIEEKGQYVTDGGSGVVSLDIGGSAYGRKSAGGREVRLYSVESHGKGSYDDVESVIESILVYSN